MAENQRVPIPSAALLRDIQEVVRWFHANGRGRLNTAAADPRKDQLFAPETHVALTPEDGIPGMGVSTGTGTDIGAGTGTGTGGPDGPGVLNSAECSIWRVGNGGELSEIGRYQQVHNLGTEDIPGGQWIVVTRLKERVWLALMPGGAGSDLVGDDSFVALLDGKVSTRSGCHCYGWREQAGDRPFCSYSDLTRHGTAGAWVKVTVVSEGTDALQAEQTVCVMDSEDCTAASTLVLTVAGNDVTAHGDLHDLKELVENLGFATVTCGGNCCTVLWNDPGAQDPITVDETDLCPAPCSPMVDWRNFLVPAADLAGVARVRAWPRYVATPSAELTKTQEGGASGYTGTGSDPAGDTLHSEWELCITDCCAGSFTLTLSDVGTGNDTTDPIRVRTDGTVDPTEIRDALEAVGGTWDVTQDGDFCRAIERTDQSGDFDLTLDASDLCACDSFGMGWFGGGDGTGGGGCADGVDADQEVVVSVECLDGDVVYDTVIFHFVAGCLVGITS